MRTPEPLLYGPIFPAPARALLVVLHTALRAAEALMRDEHPDLDDPCGTDQHHAWAVAAAAYLVVQRCAELRSLIDPF